MNTCKKGPLAESVCCDCVDPAGGRRKLQRVCERCDSGAGGRWHPHAGLRVRLQRWLCGGHGPG